MEGKGGVDYIVGSTADEGTTLFMDLPEPSLEDWQASVGDSQGEHAELFLRGVRRRCGGVDQDRRPADAGGCALHLGNAAAGHGWPRLPARARICICSTKRPPWPTMVVRSARSTPPRSAYVFGNGSELWEDADRRVSDLTQAYWVNFAKTGDPNADGLPVWPVFGADEVAFEIDADPQPLPGFRKPKLDAHDAAFGILMRRVTGGSA